MQDFSPSYYQWPCRRYSYRSTLSLGTSLLPFDLFRFAENPESEHPSGFSVTSLSSANSPSSNFIYPRQASGFFTRILARLAVSGMSFDSSPKLLKSSCSYFLIFSLCIFIWSRLIDIPISRQFCSSCPVAQPSSILTKSLQVSILLPCSFPKLVSPPLWREVSF